MRSKFQEGMGNSRNVYWIGGRTYMGRTTSKVVEVHASVKYCQLEFWGSLQHGGFNIEII